MWVAVRTHIAQRLMIKGPKHTVMGNNRANETADRMSDVVTGDVVTCESSAAMGTTSATVSVIETDDENQTR